MIPEAQAPVERLRKGRLVKASEPLKLKDHGIIWTGKARELAHPDALAAAEMIEQLSSLNEATHGEGRGTAAAGAGPERNPS